VKRILYIEDNCDTANVMKIILRKAGYDIDTAKDGQSGIEKALSSDWDLIMLDVMLPDMSGWDIFKVLKQKKESKYIFISAIPASSDRLEQIEKEGICGHIMKPFSKRDRREDN
jgi:DNA-binding response OmpR family regulator